jgi:NTP pyrophosphatase (non-canonical NTP hydrolase)
MSIIKKKLPLTELLAGLAEECTELAQAALKLRRVFDKTNPTPVTETDAINRLYEEIADVMVYLDQIPYNRKSVKEEKERKEKRWIERLGA